MVYLDYCANTPVDREILSYFSKIEEDFFGNANSAHEAGRKTAELIVKARDRIAEILDVLPEEVIFTSGASEANNTAIKGYCHARRHFGRHIITNPLEHPSVSAPLTYLSNNGYQVDMLRIGKDGKIDPDHLRSLLKEDTILLTLCAVDSELGTLQPIKEVIAILKDYPNCKLMVDATQAVGKTDICLEGIDLWTCSAHKFYGLNGSGLLIKKKDVVLEPLIHGGSSTTVYRSGTPTAALDCALEKALSKAIESQPERYERVRQLNDRLRDFFAGYPEVKINSPKDAIPHILNLSVTGIKGNTIQQLLNEKGIYVSVKTACSVEGLPSRPVLAVTNDRKRALCSWRISLSHLLKDEEISEFETVFDTIYRENLCI
ncbi:MAG: cysteine desulfurase [Erysipelotrichaceae bacterium]|nr:cysteine desulfurase [Erysipelotrichaceae bacterium]